MAVNGVDKANMQAMHENSTTQISGARNAVKETEANAPSQAAYQVEFSEEVQVQRIREMEEQEAQDEEQHENAEAEREALRRAAEQGQAQNNTYNAMGEIVG